MTRTAPRATPGVEPTPARNRPNRRGAGRSAGLGTGAVVALGMLLAACGSTTTNGPSATPGSGSVSSPASASASGTSASSLSPSPSSSGAPTTPASPAPTGASSSAVPAPTVPLSSAVPTPTGGPTPSTPPGTGGATEPSPTVPASLAPGAGPAPTVQIGQTLAGTIEPGVESGCVVLTAGGAVVANLVGKPAAELLAQGGDGPVRVRGDFVAGGVSFCQQGRLFEVSEVLPG